MSYGVNRTRKKRSTTRRKKRQRSSGRARAAAKTRSRGTSRRRVSSARRAPKRSAARRTSKSKRKRSATRSASAKKARLYTRYDPEVGTKVRVTSDSWEFANWPSRKPSKKRLQRESLKRDPLGTLGTIGTTAGKKAIERAGETAARTALRAAGIPAILAGARGAVATAAGGVTVAGVAAAASVAAILAAGYAVMSHIAASGTVALGDRLNTISTRFVETQRQLIRAAGVRTWEQVPAAVRTKAVADYKRAISTASAQGRGSANVTRPVEGSYK